MVILSHFIVYQNIYNTHLVFIVHMKHINSNHYHTSVIRTNSMNRYICMYYNSTPFQNLVLRTITNLFKIIHPLNQYNQTLYN